MLENIKKFTKINKEIFIASGALIGSAIADSVITLENISKYGIDFEGNPIITESIKYIGVNASLVLPKISSLSFIVYTAKKMNNTNYKIKGEHLLYGAALSWSTGAVLNLICR